MSSVSNAIPQLTLADVSVGRIVSSVATATEEGSSILDLWWKSGSTTGGAARSASATWAYSSARTSGSAGRSGVSKIWLREIGRCPLDAPPRRGAGRARVVGRGRDVWYARSSATPSVRGLNRSPKLARRPRRSDVPEPGCRANRRTPEQVAAARSAALVARHARDHEIRHAVDSSGDDRHIGLHRFDEHARHALVPAGEREHVHGRK